MEFEKEDNTQQMKEFACTAAGCELVDLGEAGNASSATQ
jgi:hypothetical protein